MVELSTFFAPTWDGLRAVVPPAHPRPPSGRLLGTFSLAGSTSCRGRCGFRAWVGCRPPGRARRCPPACARRRSPAAIAATSLAAAPAYWQRRGPRRAPGASHRAPPPGAGPCPAPVDIARSFAPSARRAPPVALRAPGAPGRLTCRATVFRRLDLWISE